MRIFLTGGTGFIGSHFINEAHNAGHEIVALKRPSSYTRVPLDREPFWIEGYLDSDLLSHIKGCDSLVHLAAHSPNPPYDSFSNCIYWNVYASLKLLEYAREAGVTKYLIAGSCFEYGESAKKYDKIPVDAPLNPILSYPASKAAASLAFTAFCSQFMLKIKILRIFQVYGEGEAESRLWPSLKKAALNGEDFLMTAGEQVRDFIHVKDVARSFVSELDFSLVSDGEVMIKNIGSGKPMSLREFSEKCWQEWGASGNIKFGSLPYRVNELMKLVPDL